MEGAALRILFAAPAWWPAAAFGGPIPVTRELSERLAAHGHGVSVVTTTLVDLHTRAGTEHADGDARRCACHVPLDACQLPLDGHHAFAARRAGAVGAA